MEKRNKNIILWIIFTCLIVGFFSVISLLKYTFESVLPMQGSYFI